MKHQIDPKIDCVFKALLGSEENRNLLIHFLNAVLGEDLEAPIVTVEILNPYNEKEFIDDKLSVVDVKARDEKGRLYQIEVQLSNFEALRARIAYGWADLYSGQLRSGQDYCKLQPTYAIWLLRDPLLPKETGAIHDFRLRDRKGRLLLNCGGIWVLELSKMTLDLVVTEQQRWLKFFRDGDQLNDAAPLPEWMNTDEMRQAMNTLRQFSEKERNYHIYQARQNYLRQQMTIQKELEAAVRAKAAALQEKDAALQEKDAALQEKDAAQQREAAALQEKDAAQQREAEALAEIERLKALLRG